MAVPNVTGRSRADAADALADLGLTMRRAEGGRYDDQVPAGRVVRQSPDARTLVQRGSSVGVVLSLRPRPAQVPPPPRKALPAGPGTPPAVRPAAGSLLAPL